MNQGRTNTDWADYVQSAELLCESRLLRFDDIFAESFTRHFALDNTRKLKILELGCGPGALASKLADWYPNAALTGLDRDSSFISYAKQRFGNRDGRLDFIVGDAVATEMPSESFDVTISNTVCEHIETSAFFLEQRRVLKPGGNCIVISTRKTLRSPILKETDEFETAFWQRVEEVEKTAKREPVEVCRYPLNESELPSAMEKYGFRYITTGYAAIDLTPDDPKYTSDFALKMLHSDCVCEVSSVDTVRNTYPGIFSDNEINEMHRHIEKRYAVRRKKYELGEKLWDTTVLIIMISKGTKPE